MDLKIIYEDKDVLVVDKPAGIVVFPEGESLKSGEKTLIDYLIEKYPKLVEAGPPPRYGIAHRLDKDTSGVLLVAKSSENLIFLQKQFSLPAVALQNKAKEGAGSKPLEKRVEKMYIALVEGNIENEKGIIHTLIARAKGDPRKQRAYSEINAQKSAREAITEYKVIGRYKSPTSPRLRGVTPSQFTLLEVKIKTGRRHQIRCHFSYLKHPIAGDKLYSFKNSKIPSGLARQFLHSAYLKIQLPNGEIKEFESELPEELNNILNKLEK